MPEAADPLAPGTQRTVAVSGSSGYLGGLVVGRFERSGWNVVRLERPRDDRPSTPNRRPFVLGDQPAPGLLDDVEVLVHCAYDLTVTRAEDISRINVEGSRRLLDSATDAGVSRIVSVS